MTFLMRCNFKVEDKKEFLMESSNKDENVETKSTIQVSLKERKCFRIL
jgi:hypothetical protein